MNKIYFYPQSFGRVFIFQLLLILVTVFGAFLLLSNKAHAADAGEFVHFRIDTELDSLNFRAGDTTNKVTVEWSCTGTASGSILDNTASESSSDLDNTLDGIISVASASKEMTDAGCTIAGAKWNATTKNISAKASINGWVTRRWTEATALASSAAAFTTRASMDYLLTVTGAKDELGNAFNMASTSNATNTFASASYSGTLASSSYHANAWYGAPIADGTLSGGKNGYVNKTSTVIWSSDYSTTSKSADFGTSTNSTYNGDALPFAVKATLNGTHSNGATETNITGSTVTAGDSGGTSCTGSGGSYYCAVPLAHTGVVATATTLHGFTQTLTCTYTARTVGSDDQSTCNITATEAVSAGSGGDTTTTITPTPTPSVEPTPTPTPSTTPGITPTPSSIVSASPTPLVSTVPVTVMLFRKANDPKVYVKGSDGTLRWVRTAAEFVAAGYNWADVKMISGSDFAKMRIGGSVRVVKGVAFLRVRSTPSTAGKMIGKVLPGQELKFTEIKNGWYHIDSGWVSGGYAKEF